MVASCPLHPHANGTAPTAATSGHDQDWTQGDLGRSCSGLYLVVGRQVAQLAHDLYDLGTLGRHQLVAISGDGSPLGMGAIAELLSELRIDHVTIQGITDALDEGAAQVDAYEPAQVPPRRFGTLTNGASLGHHTELARRAVREAIWTMVSDLQHYHEGVETFRKGVNVADEHAREDIAHIAQEVGSVRSATEGGLDR